MPLKPIAFCNGDDSARRAATMAREIVFSDFPMVEVDTGVEARITTNDKCIQAAAEAIAECGSGVKISTASDDHQIKSKGWKSANIQLRKMLGAVGLFRATLAPGRFKKPVAVFRYGSGDFYNEISCDIKNENGLEKALITQEMIVSDLFKFAELAAKKAKMNDMKMILSSKWTISEGEKLITDKVKLVWDKMGLTMGEKRNQGDYWMELTDICAARIPINVGGDEGGWLIVTGNANGDTMSDIADFQHGNNAMGSEVICREGFSYHELPGGTAPGRKNSDFTGPNFFSPIGTLGAFCGAISDINPEAKSYTDKVMKYAIHYLETVQEDKRSTEELFRYIIKKAK